MPQPLGLAEGTVSQSGHYNLRNAHYQMEQWLATVEAYKAALRLNPNDMDAKYNLEWLSNTCPGSSKRNNSNRRMSSQGMMKSHHPTSNRIKSSKRMTLQVMSSRSNRRKIFKNRNPLTNRSGMKKSKEMNRTRKSQSGDQQEQEDQITEDSTSNQSVGNQFLVDLRRNFAR